MRRSQIYFITFIIIIIIVLFGFQYLFSIYEVEIKVTSYILYADNKSETTINTAPLNSFGMRIPFRNAAAQIDIIEGADLIDVIEEDEDTGVLKIKARNRTGTVVINIRPEKALLPTTVEIRIEPNIT